MPPGCNLFLAARENGHRNAKRLCSDLSRFRVGCISSSGSLWECGDSAQRDLLKEPNPRSPTRGKRGVRSSSDSAAPLVKMLQASMWVIPLSRAAKNAHTTKTHPTRSPPLLLRDEGLPTTQHYVFTFYKIQILIFVIFSKSSMRIETRQS